LRLSTIIGQRRHDLETRMEGLVFRDVPSRLADQLLRLAEQYGRQVEGEMHIDLRLSQLELANLIGATRETTSTAINEMKRAGILDTSHRTIVIKNLPALREVKERI
jgi:CRP/FNR family transcriptional regulator, cyclic AMP receptor protein